MDYLLIMGSVLASMYCVSGDGLVNREISLKAGPDILGTGSMGLDDQVVTTSTEECVLECLLQWECFIVFVHEAGDGRFYCSTATDKTQLPPVTWTPYTGAYVSHKYS